MDDAALDAAIYKVATTPTKTAPTSGFQLFKSSDHPARPRNADVRDGKGDVAAFTSVCAQIYSTLPDREEFERQAREINAARRAVIPEADAPREECVCSSYLWHRSLTACSGRQVDKLIPLLLHLFEKVSSRTGYVGWLLIGGVNEHGSIESHQYVVFTQVPVEPRAHVL